MEMLPKQVLGEKAIIIFQLLSLGWKLSTVKKVCSRVARTGSAILHKPGSAGPATACACTACRVNQISHWPYQALQEAQLSQRDRATLLVIERFAKSLKITQGHSKRHCWVGRV